MPKQAEYMMQGGENLDKYFDKDFKLIGSAQDLYNAMYKKGKEIIGD